METEQTERKPSSVIATDHGRFRRLGNDELVLRGDFVENEPSQLTPWEGPNGFRASSFSRPVYRIVDTTSAKNSPNP